MAHNDNKPTERRPGYAAGVSPQDLWRLEKYFMHKGTSEFVYDEKLDVFRFPEDGGFAFCDEFADWKRLQERGYVDL